MALTKIKSSNFEPGAVSSAIVESYGDTPTEGQSLVWSAAQGKFIPGAPAGAGVTVYSTISELPLSNNSSGALSLVSDNNRLYIWNGAGWFNIAILNQSPTISSGALASYTRSILSSNTNITLTASDPEELPLTYSYSITSGSLQDATVTQANNVFTITPGATATSFGISFTASDGVNIATSTSTFNIINDPPVFNTSPAPTYSLMVEDPPTVITLAATDPEGQPITWSYSITSGSLQDATVTQANNVFTITPGASSASFGISFTASDGINTTSSSSAVSIITAVIAEILLVGGGGAGGNGWAVGGGGGGGGTVIHDTSTALLYGTLYNIIVGAGANAYANTYTFGQDQGASSSAFGYIAPGGGSGAEFSGAGSTAQNARSGGSGGGGNGNGLVIGSGDYTNAPQQQGAAAVAGTFPAGNITALSYQNSGGRGGQWSTYTNRGAGGGGGAGAAGQNSYASGGSYYAGSGGDGVQISITGTPTYYGGGGAGGRRENTVIASSGGLGGGGVERSPGVNGLGGGGGGGTFSQTVDNNKGGSGVVIIRTLNTATSTTGSPTVTTDGSYNIYKFLQNGSITF